VRLMTWWHPAPFRPDQPGADLRPLLASVMCWWCARRWLAGRRISHPGCVDELNYAFDVFLHRPR
jgi:hypothetical protein